MGPSSALGCSSRKSRSSRLLSQLEINEKSAEVDNRAISSRLIVYNASYSGDIHAVRNLVH
jgi:hypothetical protein